MSAITLSLPGQAETRLKEGLLVLGASLLIALTAQIGIVTPLSPIPFIIYGHLCLLLGALLGPKKGALIVGLYLLEGAVGLPFFAKGGSGLATLFGPRCGYFLGFLLGAALTGYLASRAKTAVGMLSAFLAGNALVLFFGAAYLSLFIGLKAALLVGVAPFVVTEIFKCVLATKAYQAFRRRIG